jgi:hypothetical protein
MTVETLQDWNHPGCALSTIESASLRIVLDPFP